MPAELPTLVMGYKTPVLKTAEEPWKAYALEVLAGVLDGGSSARLTRDLIRGQQIAAGVGAGYDLTALRGGMLTLSGTPSQGHTVEELEKALRAQIQRLRDEPVARDELERIKAQVTAGKVYEKDSIFYQAMQIGTLETVGLDWRLMDEYVERVAAVTPAQVQQVAREYLNDEVLTVALLDPLPLGDKKPAPAMGGMHDAIH
jgi:zinc protease